MAKIMTSEDYKKYFSNERENIRVIDMSKISVPSGYLTAMDYSDADLVGGEYTPYFTEKIPAGEYDVKGCVEYSVGAWGTIAAVKVEITSEEPVTFKMAVSESQDISKLDEDQFFGFSVDSGFAMAGDVEVINEYCRILEEFDENEDVTFPAIEYYEAEIEKQLEYSYKKYPDCRIEYINYTVPETGHHMLFMRTGQGDGVYPTYFGYDKNGEICCAVTEFVFTNDTIFN